MCADGSAANWGRESERVRDEVWNGKLRGRAKEEHGRIEEERGEEGNKTR